MNYTTRWFYKAISDKEVNPGALACAVCGLPMSAGIPVGKVLRSTFTNYDLLARPDSTQVCPACAWYFDHQELLRSHWYLTSTEARPLAKVDILPLLAEHLEHPPTTDGYYLLAQTKHKHIALRGRLNAAGCRMLRVNLEELLVDVNADFLALMESLAALRRYHAWDEIQSDRYLPYAILRWPRQADFVRAREEVRPWLRSPQFHLARWLSSREVVKDEPTIS